LIIELSKLQTIALVILTTILTDKFLISHNLPSATTTTLISPTPSISEVTIPSPPTNISPTSNSNSNIQTEIILRELINLRKDMAASFEKSAEQTTTNTSPAPTLTASLLGGMVKISSSQWKTVDVFEKPLSSSKIIAALTYDNIYFYQQKQGGWYQISLDSGQLGWVQSQFLKEFP